ncbi:low temperature requirement protein A [Micromonospora sp. WMMD812]|uniref:low temperature requirement protein A n=1 Tax=Micromonospora sp. WMMD812 TaxID=3015152 RepID=UPI00248CE38C|nr:low temperature requirement protein A [Micromonospora sp. WMMD812]WBB69112.1 low temperature requirement protein A [Micromonospora sp. WMMD812]
MRGFGRLHLAHGEGRVTRLELFLDLIFVFAFLNVTGVTAEHLNPAGLARGLLLLVLLWGCWAPYAWLGNIVRLDRGIMPVFVFGLSALLFVLGLTAREAFVDRPGGLSGPIVFAVCYILARGSALTFATAAGVAEPGTRRRLRKAGPALASGGLALLAAALVTSYEHSEQGFGADGATREWIRFTLVAVAIVAAYAGALLLGSGTWQIRSIRYWVERHSLIILIGVGEAIISVGLGQGVAVAHPLTLQLLAGALLGVALAGFLWWTYFDVARFAAEQALERASEARRALLGRDAYSFLHLPMMAGLILVALGIHHMLSEMRVPSETSAEMRLLVLYGGVILYLVGLILFEVRTLRLLGRSPILGILLVGSLAVIAPRVPVLAQLALLTAAVGAMALADATVFRRRHRRLHAEIQPVLLKQTGVTPKELFFDLVYVYAFLQVAALMAEDPTWRGVVRGLLVLIVLWSAWCAYTWLGIAVRSERPVVLLLMVLVVALTALITLASPEAFNADGSGLPGPLVFVACYALIRLLFLGAFWLNVRHNPTQRAAVGRNAVPTLLALAILSAAALIPEPAGDTRLLTPARAGLWIAAIAVDLVGNRLAARRHPWTWSAEHWADRYSLIIIIALGQAVISMGTAVVYTPISARIIVATVLGTALLTALWWIYFSTTAIHGKRMLSASQQEQRAVLAQDAYALLHLPMIAGIVFVSLGLGKTMSVLGSRGLFELGAPLYPLPHLALFGGVIIYLLADHAFRWRLTRRSHPHRIAQTLVITALAPATAQLPALAALAALTAVCLGFLTIEVKRRGTIARPAR